MSLSATEASGGARKKTLEIVLARCIDMSVLVTEVIRDVFLVCFVFRLQGTAI